MHLRYTETDIHLLAAFELRQFLNCCVIIQVSKAPRYEFPFCLQPGGLIQVVITAEIIFIEQQVNLFATLAAEIPVFSNNGLAAAGVAAVITINRYVCRTIDRFSFCCKKSRRTRICSG